MTDDALIDALTNCGLDARVASKQWLDAAPLLAALDAIGRNGESVVVKVDGLRDDQTYTVVISGGASGERFFRRDGAELQPLLREAIRAFLDRAPGQGPPGEERPRPVDVRSTVIPGDRGGS